MRSTGGEAGCGEMSLEAREMKDRSHLTCPGPSLGFALYLKSRHFSICKMRGLRIRVLKLGGYWKGVIFLIISITCLYQVERSGLLNVLQHLGQYY